MKNLKLLGYLMVFASALLCVQCTSDPIPGPAGADGTDGINGIDGVDGVDGSAESCIACHSDEKRDPIIDAWSGPNTLQAVPGQEVHEPVVQNATTTKAL